MLETGTFTDLQVFGNAFVGGELLVSEMDILTDITVSGMASISTLEVGNELYAPSFVSTSNGNMFIFGDVEFAGNVSGLPEGPMGPQGFPGEDYYGPKMHAARIAENGDIGYNNGFASIGVSTTAPNMYEYVFAEPIFGAEYSVVATSNDNRNNIHCNIIQLNGFGFVVETGKNASKPFPCAHSVQVLFS